MAKPVKHRNGWRIRWFDEKGKRQSAVYADYKVAQNEVRRRQLEVAEIKSGARSAPPPPKNVFMFYATAIYTGMRAGELAALEGSDILFDRRLIIVQRSFFGPTKSDRARYVPILDPLLPLLQQWRLRQPGRLVFTNMAGAMLQPSSRIFQEVLHRVLDAAAFEKVVRNGRERPCIRFHDLRHTFASHWVARGGDLFKLQKILGHQSVQMTMRYAHLAPEAYREVHGRLGARVPLGASHYEVGAT